MIRCAKCDNETRASELVMGNRPVMLAGPAGTEPQPILAQVCTACGYIELYGPQPILTPQAERTQAAELELIPAPVADPAL